MEIDEQLCACGWVVQDYKHAAVAAALGVAVREVPTEAGPADYVLFVDRQAVGVIEAKKAGSTLTGVEPQTRKYQVAYPEELPAFEVDGALPFGYESTGVETRFTCGLDPVPASRRVFTFHRPETLAYWHDEHVRLGGYATLRAGLPLLPELGPDAPVLWPAQAEAIRNLEASLRANRPRALIQMATGAGKTFTAANVCYRLVRHANAVRVLFLVDRANLGRQALREFQGFAAPDDPRKFSELYNVRHLTDSRVDMAAETSTKVHICTIQRLFSILRGDDPEGFDDSLDERSGFEVEPAQPVEVAYNPKMPIESYDLIIVDECHRSIYGVWRQVLEYFDAFLVGLTATPGIQTFAFFDQNLVMEYGHAQAVADRVNVDFDVFRIRTEITESGGTVPAGFVTGFRDRDTRQLRLEKVDEDIDYNAADLDRRVVAPDQIRTVVRTLRDSLPKIFNDRELRGDGLLKHVPKTLIFAKDDSHADDIVQIVREEFGLSNEGAVKITYRSVDSGNKPEELLQQFRTNYPTRIAVTVDMIATGTDVKPIECVVFMRMVRSRNFFEQMKGRGVRVIDAEDLRRVTPDAKAKDRFVIVDAVGVTEAGLHDTVPLERQHGVSFDRLLNQVGLGSVDPDVVSSVASRLARLNRRITAEDRAELEQVAGVGLDDLVRRITDALDPDRQHDAAAAATGVDDPTPEQIAAAARQLITDAVQPIAGNPQAAGEAGRGPPQLPTGDRHRVGRPGDLRRVLPRGRRPGPRPHRVVPPVHRRQQGRDHRPASALQPALRRRAHLPRHQRTGPSHRTPTPPLDTRNSLAGVRDPRRLQGQRIKPPRQHRPSKPRPSRPRPHRRIGVVPRAGERTLRSLAPPTATNRTQLHQRPDRLPPPDQRTPSHKPHRRPRRPPRPTLQHPRRPKQGTPTLRQRLEPAARRTNSNPRGMTNDLPPGWAESD